MTARLPLAAGLALLPLCLAACKGGNGDSVKDVGADDTATGGADDSAGGDQGGDDTDSGVDDTGGGGGTVFDLGDPLITAQLAGATWQATEGYYFATGSTSTINASIPDGAPASAFTITIDGDISKAGSFEVRSVVYSETPASDPTVQYSADDTSGLSFSVEGFAEGTYVFGELTGSADLDGLELDGVTLVSWPSY